MNIKDKLAKYRDARVRELESEIRERDVRIRNLENQINRQGAEHGDLGKRNQEAHKLLRSLDIEPVGCIWHQVLDVAAIMLDSAAVDTNVKEKALAHERNATRLPEARAYCEKHGVGTWGDIIWHAVLDDAIKLRLEMREADHERL